SPLFHSFPTRRSSDLINFLSSSSVNSNYVFRKLGIHQSFRRCLSCTYAERENRHILLYCQKTRKSVALLPDRVPFWLSCAKIPFSLAHVLFHHIPFCLAVRLQPGYLRH